MPEPMRPERLLLLRHGESAGNLARDAAEASGVAMIDIETRDMDVALSDLGRQQAGAVGRWLKGGEPDRRPTVVYCSPYVRACETARLALESAGISLDEVGFEVDERLREREFGVLDRLTRVGISERHPDQAGFRAHLGKFYHRPPGGESWADVILRVRSLVDTLTRECAGERVLIVTHQVVVLMFRYVLEHLSEEQVLDIDRRHELANCSVTSYLPDGAARSKPRLVLELFNHVAPLEQEGAEVTAERDAPVAGH